MGLSNALNNRPVRVLGVIASVHAIVYAVGMFFGTGGFGETVIYKAFGPQLLIDIFAAVLLVTGGLLTFAYIRNNPKTIRLASGGCGLAWLFATFMYLFNGAWLLAIGIGLPWTILAFYLAYAHGNRVNIIDYDQTFAARRDTANEDQL